MDGNLKAILDSLPPKPPRSKLEPYAELIRELRKRERSYRDIAGILRERCGLSVGVHTLYSFVKVRGLDTAVEVDQSEKQQSRITAGDPEYRPDAFQGGRAANRIESAPDQAARQSRRNGLQSGGMRSRSRSGSNEDRL